MQGTSREKEYEAGKIFLQKEKKRFRSVLPGSYIYFGNYFLLLQNLEIFRIL
jgi:hypothetical protein